jgi:hypothetical protein
LVQPGTCTVFSKKRPAPVRVQNILLQSDIRTVSSNQIAVQSPRVRGSTVGPTRDLNSFLQKRPEQQNSLLQSETRTACSSQIPEQSAPIRDQNSLLQLDSRTVPFNMREYYWSNPGPEQSSLKKTRTACSSQIAEQSAPIIDQNSLLQSDSRTVCSNHNQNSLLQPDSRTVCSSHRPEQPAPVR